MRGERKRERRREEEREGGRREGIIKARTVQTRKQHPSTPVSSLAPCAAVASLAVRAFTVLYSTVVRA